MAKNAKDYESMVREILRRQSRKGRCDGRFAREARSGQMLTRK